MFIAQTHSTMKRAASDQGEQGLLHPAAVIAVIVLLMLADVYFGTAQPLGDVETTLIGAEIGPVPVWVNEAPVPHEPLPTPARADWSIRAADVDEPVADETTGASCACY